MPGALLPSGVLEEFRGGLVKGSLVDRVENALTDAPFPGVRLDRPVHFELLQVPQDGLVLSPQSLPNISRRGSLGMLPQVTEDGRPERGDPKDRNRHFRAGSSGGHWADIAGHSFILSQNTPHDFPCLIQLDTLHVERMIKLDTR